MDRLLELVRLHRLGTNAREVARLLRMSPNTERRYRLQLREAELLEGPADTLPSREALRAACAIAGPRDAPEHEQSSVEAWGERIGELWKAGAGPQAIHDRLRLEASDFDGSLSAVKRYCLRLRRERGVDPNEVAIPVEVVLGEAQVDFGYVGKLYDPERGQLRKAWVFVLTLAGSGKMVVRVVFDQTVSTWLRLHVEAFEELGGVPTVVVPDNLKSAVIRAAFGLGDNAALNRSYRELARHYGFKIDPTPPHAPRKKGRVEVSVKYVKKNFFSTLEAVDIDEVQRQLARWNAEIADRRRHGRTGRPPVEVFEEAERTTLLSLPPRRFEPVVWKKAKVHRDCHINFDHRLYSVPWRFVGKDVWVRATMASIEVYLDDVRVATHQRSHNKYRVTSDNHLPEERRDLRHRSRSFWLERAEKLGPQSGELVRRIFEADDVLHQLRAVQATVTHLETFPVERAEAAAKRALYYGAFEYRAVRDILRAGLDMQPLPIAVTEAEPSGEYRFARSAQELLQLPLETTDEPH